MGIAEFYETVRVTTLVAFEAHFVGLAAVGTESAKQGGKETAGVDIFRFDADGRIVEHWDVLQPVPDSANNKNGMF